MAYLTESGGSTYNPYPPLVGPYNTRGAGRTPGNGKSAAGLFKPPDPTSAPFNPKISQFGARPESFGRNAPSPFDISGDPMLQQVRGFNVRENNQYGANATDSYRKTLLAFGSRELAKAMFGGDQSFMDAVGNNPFSRMANIRNQYEGRGGEINQANEALNNKNLFFSSERTANVLPELMRQRLGQEYQGNIDAQDAMSQIGRTLYEQQNAALMRELQAMQDARDRATSAALSSGYGPGSADPQPSGVTAPDFFSPLAGVSTGGTGGYAAYQQERRGGF